MVCVKNKDNLDRRRFLRLGGLSALAGIFVFNRQFVDGALAGTVLDRVSQSIPPVGTQRSLNLHNIHTGENLQCVFRSEGTYDQAALTAVDRLLRDHRTGDIHPIDPALLELMDAIACGLQVNPVFHVISGFRSARTNQVLRNQGRNVASKSYHLLGQAVDIRMPGVDVTRLHKAALAQGQGGVGLYRGQDFVHIDTGPVRTW